MFADNIGFTTVASGAQVHFDHRPVVFQTPITKGDQQSNYRIAAKFINGAVGFELVRLTAGNDFDCGYRGRIVGVVFVEVINGERKSNPRGKLYGEVDPLTGVYTTCEIQLETDRLRTIVHEMLHGLGLDHDELANSIMAPRSREDDDSLYLTPDDTARLKRMYRYASRRK